VNFLNPLALIGMIAAGIPLLLHLFNLRRLRTVEFSTLRFILELQQTRVRKLKLQQLLLLILRTLVVAFAVLAFARPTVPSNLPLLTSTTHASVVIVVDNSASMDIADQNGVRFHQAQKFAHQVIDMMRDGDEISVISLIPTPEAAGAGFSRVFSQAHSRVNALHVSDGLPDTESLMEILGTLFADASHPHKEIYFISDGQKNLDVADATEAVRGLKIDASVFILPVGQGVAGIDQNLSVDSVTLRSVLPQVGKPIEVEAYVRNGTSRDAKEVPVSMSVGGLRAAQRVIDVPAGQTRSVVLGAPVSHTGVASISVDVENDALNRDNSQYLGVMVPPPARVAVIGSGITADLAVLALSLQASQAVIGSVQRYTDFRMLGDAGEQFDVLYLAGANIGVNDVPPLLQFVQDGGGVVTFISDNPAMRAWSTSCGLSWEGMADNSSARLTTIDEGHPLLWGVFNTSGPPAPVESPVIYSQVRIRGGTTIASSELGPFLTVTHVGAGKVLFFTSMADGKQSTLGSTGLFAALMVRSALYLSSSNTQVQQARINESVMYPIPRSYQGVSSFTVTDAQGYKAELAPVRLPSGVHIPVPAQSQPGIVTIATSTGTVIGGITVVRPSAESILRYFSEQEFTSLLGRFVVHPDRVLMATGRSMHEAVRSARIGSELWPLCIILALFCAITEMVIARLSVQENQESVIQ